MNIAIIGYGKMGKAVETIALERGHTIGLKVINDRSEIDYSEIDVAIDFARRARAELNARERKPLSLTSSP